MATVQWNEQLRLERINRNWRQHDLAEQLGTSVVTIQRWEQGNHLPSVYFRTKLCILFGKSARELGFISDALEGSCTLSISSVKRRTSKYLT